MLIPITVHIPEERVPDFYAQFGHFAIAKADTDLPLRIEGRALPRWVNDENAQELADALMRETSFLGSRLLERMTGQVEGEEPARISAQELTSLFAHPNGSVSHTAGVLGGVGKAIRRAGLPVYKLRSGGTWHYIWDWDGDVYTMQPEVATLIRKAARRTDRDR
jgi:hypothetical protein